MKMRFLCFGKLIGIICALACIAFSGLVAAAEPVYWRITTDRTTVITASTELRCKRLTAQLLAFERVLGDLAGWEETELPPIALYGLFSRDAERVFLSKEDVRRQRETNTRIYSKFLPGPDFNLAVIMDGVGGDEPLQSVLLLYAQTVMQLGANRGLPLWFQLGVPNVLNGLLVRDDGSILLNRNQLFEPATDSKQPGRVNYDLPRLLQAGSEVFADGGDARSYVRRVREWAIFGLLTTEERRSQFRELATLMRQGEPAEEAVPAAFGVPLTELAAQFEKGDWRKQAQFRIPGPALLASLPVATKLGAEEMEPLLQVVASRTQRD